MQAMLQHFGSALRGYVAAATGAAAAGLAAAGVEISLPQVSLLHSFRFIPAISLDAKFVQVVSLCMAAGEVAHSSLTAHRMLPEAVIANWITDLMSPVIATLQEAGLLAALLRQLEAAGGVPAGQLAAHVPGLVLEAHHLAAL